MRGVGGGSHHPGSGGGGRPRGRGSSFHNRQHSNYNASMSGGLGGGPPAGAPASRGHHGQQGTPPMNSNNPGGGSRAPYGNAHYRNTLGGGGYRMMRSVDVNNGANNMNNGSGGASGDHVDGGGGGLQQRGLSPLSGPGGFGSSVADGTTNVNAPTTLSNNGSAGSSNNLTSSGNMQSPPISGMTSPQGGSGYIGGIVNGGSSGSNLRHSDSLGRSRGGYHHQHGGPHNSGSSNNFSRMMSSGGGGGHPRSAAGRGYMSHQSQQAQQHQGGIGYTPQQSGGNVSDMNSVTDGGGYHSVVSIGTSVATPSSPVSVCGGRPTSVPNPGATSPNEGNGGASATAAAPNSTQILSSSIPSTAGGHMQQAQPSSQTYAGGASQYQARDPANYQARESGDFPTNMGETLLQQQASASPLSSAASGGPGHELKQNPQPRSGGLEGGPTRADVQQPQSSSVNSPYVGVYKNISSFASTSGNLQQQMTADFHLNISKGEDCGDRVSERHSTASTGPTQHRDGPGQHRPGRRHPQQPGGAGSGRFGGDSGGVGGRITGDPGSGPGGYRNLPSYPGSPADMQHQQASAPSQNHINANNQHSPGPIPHTAGYHPSGPSSMGNVVVVAANSPASYSRQPAYYSQQQQPQHLQQHQQQHQQQQQIAVSQQQLQPSMAGATIGWYASPHQQHPQVMQHHVQQHPSSQFNGALGQQQMLTQPAQGAIVFGTGYRPSAGELSYSAAVRDSSLTPHEYVTNMEGAGMMLSGPLAFMTTPGGGVANVQLGHSVSGELSGDGVSIRPDAEGGDKTAAPPRSSRILFGHFGVDGGNAGDPTREGPTPSMRMSSPAMISAFEGRNLSSSSPAGGGGGNVPFIVAGHRVTDGGQFLIPHPGKGYPGQAQQTWTMVVPQHPHPHIYFPPIAGSGAPMAHAIEMAPGACTPSIVGSAEVTSEGAAEDEKGQLNGSLKQLPQQLPSANARPPSSADDSPIGASTASNEIPCGTGSGRLGGPTSRESPYDLDYSATANAAVLGGPSDVAPSNDNQGEDDAGKGDSGIVVRRIGSAALSNAGSASSNAGVQDQQRRPRNPLPIINPSTNQSIIPPSIDGEGAVGGPPSSTNAASALRHPPQLEATSNSDNAVASNDLRLQSADRSAPSATVGDSSAVITNKADTAMTPIDRRQQQQSEGELTGATLGVMEQRQGGGWQSRTSPNESDVGVMAGAPIGANDQAGVRKRERRKVLNVGVQEAAQRSLSTAAASSTISPPSAEHDVASRLQYGQPPQHQQITAPSLPRQQHSQVPHLQVQSQQPSLIPYQHYYHQQLPPQSFQHHHHQHPAHPFGLNPHMAAVIPSPHLQPLNHPLDMSSTSVPSPYSLTSAPGGGYAVAATAASVGVNTSQALRPPSTAASIGSGQQVPAVPLRLTLPAALSSGPTSRGQENELKAVAGIGSTTRPSRRHKIKNVPLMSTPFSDTSQMTVHPSADAGSQPKAGSERAEEHLTSVSAAVTASNRLQPSGAAAGLVVSAATSTPSPASDSHLERPAVSQSLREEPLKALTAGEGSQPSLPVAGAQEAITQASDSPRLHARNRAGFEGQTSPPPPPVESQQTGPCSLSSSSQSAPPLSASPQQLAVSGEADVSKEASEAPLSGPAATADLQSRSPPIASPASLLLAKLRDHVDVSIRKYSVFGLLSLRSKTSSAPNLGISIWSNSAFNRMMSVGISSVHQGPPRKINRDALASITSVVGGMASARNVAAPPPVMSQGGGWSVVGGGMGGNKGFMGASMGQRDQRDQRDPPPPQNMLNRVGRPAFEDMTRTMPAARPRAVTPKSRALHLRRSVKALCNKLTIELFEKIAEKIGLILETAQGPDDIKIIVEEVFQKAVTEPRYSEIYADLVVVLEARSPVFPVPEQPTADTSHTQTPAVPSEAESPAPAAEAASAVAAPGGTDGAEPARPQKVITFIRHFLDACQDEFDELIKNTSLDLAPEECANKTPEDIQFEIKRRKNRVLGNIRFIGELRKRTILRNLVVKKVIEDLLNLRDPPEEHFVECACELLTTLGFYMEQSSKNIINPFFDRLKELQRTGHYSKRIEFKILDLIELRAKDWRQKVFFEKAKALSDIRREFVAEERSGGAIIAAQTGKFETAGQQDKQPYHDYVEMWKARNKRGNLPKAHGQQPQQLLSSPQMSNDGHNPNLSISHPQTPVPPTPSLRVLSAGPLAGDALYSGSSMARLQVDSRTSRSASPGRSPSLPPQPPSYPGSGHDSMPMPAPSKFIPPPPPPPPDSRMPPPSPRSVPRSRTASLQPPNVAGWSISPKVSSSPVTLVPAAPSAFIELRETNRQASPALTALGPSASATVPPLASDSGSISEDDVALEVPAMSEHVHRAVDGLKRSGSLAQFLSTFESLRLSANAATREFHALLEVVAWENGHSGKLLSDALAGLYNAAFISPQQVVQRIDRYLKDLGEYSLDNPQASMLLGRFMGRILHSVLASVWEVFFGGRLRAVSARTAIGVESLSCNLRLPPEREVAMKFCVSVVETVRICFEECSTTVDVSLQGVAVEDSNGGTPLDDVSSAGPAATMPPPSASGSLMGPAARTKGAVCNEGRRWVTHAVFGILVAGLARSCSSSNTETSLEGDEELDCGDKINRSAESTHEGQEVERSAPRGHEAGVDSSNPILSDALELLRYCKEAGLCVPTSLMLSAQLCLSANLALSFERENLVLAPATPESCVANAMPAGDTPEGQLLTWSGLQTSVLKLSPTFALHDPWLTSSAESEPLVGSASLQSIADFTEAHKRQILLAWFRALAFQTLQALVRKSQSAAAVSAKLSHFLTAMFAADNFEIHLGGSSVIVELALSTVAHLLQLSVDSAVPSQGIVKGLCKELLSMIEARLPDATAIRSVQELSESNFSSEERQSLKALFSG